MLREPRRLIIIATLWRRFAAATFFLSASLEKSINVQITGAAADAAVIVSPNGMNGGMSAPIQRNVVAALKALPGVTGSRRGVHLAEQKTSKGGQCIELREPAGRGGATTITEGRPCREGRDRIHGPVRQGPQPGARLDTRGVQPRPLETATYTVVGLIAPGPEYGDASAVRDRH